MAPSTRDGATSVVARSRRAPAPRRSAGRRRPGRGARRLAGLLRLAVFLLLVFVAVWAGVRVANATVTSEAFDGSAYEVRVGDTLWQIAAHEYGTRQDLRAAVFAIREANGLDGALLQPGETLVLPYLEE